MFIPVEAKRITGSGGYYVYIITDERNKIYYTGLTDDIIRRNYEHKMGMYDGFTKRYRVHKLVYYEMHSSYEKAQSREKLIKRWKRMYKTSVIEKMNPNWRDLFYDLAEIPDPATGAGIC